MDLGTLPASLTPYKQIGVASAPLFVSLLVRLFIGKSRVLNMVVMGSATWLAMNTLLSPYMDMMNLNSATLRGLLGN